MNGRLRAALCLLGTARSVVVVPRDGDPLSDGELAALITVMRSYRDSAGTRRVAPLERHAEQAAARSRRP